MLKAVLLVATCLLVCAATARAAPSVGAELYGTNCSSCHGAKGQGSIDGPPLIGKSAADVHFMLDTGRMPAAIPNEQEMHKTPKFTGKQIDEIVGFVMTFSPNADHRLPVVGPGNVDHGRLLFAANCAQCHGVTGSGASVGYANVAPPLAYASKMQVAEAIRIGPGVMPRFGTDVLSTQDVSDIARYVNYLQTQTENPGGLALANIGPVAEGFIGWFIGLGALVLLVRRIGTTS
ncbi:MAG: c-type cytochrome [Candidatus Eremiobacteraeota bacterium]|nr:c-type cytochrome [Candidatus Eremiobacteraeota bacterium]